MRIANNGKTHIQMKWKNKQPREKTARLSKAEGTS